MPKPKSTESLVMVETAFLASTTAMIFLFNFYFPLGPFLRMFFPVPIALAYLRWNGRAAWMTMIVTALLLSVLMGPTRSIQFLIPHGLVGLTLGFLWHKRSSWAISLLAGTIVNTLGTAFQLVLLSVLLSQNLWIYITSQITGFVGWLMRLLGSLDEPDIFVVQVFAVAGIIVSSFMYQLLVHLGAWLLLDRIGNPIPPAPKWLEWLLT